MFAPSFQGLAEVVADGFVIEEAPGLVHDENFERGCFGRVVDGAVGSMKYVEKQWFEDDWVFVEAFEVEALEVGEGEGVVDVIEEVAVLSAFNPAGEAAFEALGEDAGEGQEAAVFGVNLEHGADLFEEFFAFGDGERRGSIGFEEYSKEREYELVIGRIEGQGKWVDLEGAVLNGHFRIGPFEQRGKMLVTSTEIEYDCKWIVFLQIGDEEV